MPRPWRNATGMATATGMVIRRRRRAISFQNAPLEARVDEHLSAQEHAMMINRREFLAATLAVPITHYGVRQPPLQRDEALKELRLLEAAVARRSLLAFTQYTMPAFEVNWHHERIAQALDAVLRGEIKRLMIFMPPQNGKSELVSRRFPAYALGKNPNLQLISCSYSADLSREMSQDVQKVIETDEYRTLFPRTRLARAKDVGDVRTSDRFDIPGFEGAYRSAGVGGSITGKPMHLGIIDDPVKNRAEAESETYRRTVWNWYTADFSGRHTTDKTSVVLVQTRWHEDDLAGRLLRLAAESPLADQWTVVSFPAIAEVTQPSDPRAPGEALWPTRFSKAWLEGRRAGIGIYDWSALYQQSPVPAGGAMAQRAWFPVVEHRYAHVLRRCRAWDLAGTIAVSGNEPAWTVGTLLAQCLDPLTQHVHWVVEHVVRDRLTSAGVDALMVQTARADGRQTLVREWQDPGQAGKAVIAAHRRLLAGYDYDAVLASGEKTLQWRPFLVQAEGGDARLVSGAWNTAWLDEMSLIPYGRFFDQADSVALAFNVLADAKERGPSIGAILPMNAAGQPSDGLWRTRFR